MSRGIKKISENVIADKRSLNLVTGNPDNNYPLPDPDSGVLKPYGITNTEAMPLGMLNVDYVSKGIFMKVSQGKGKDSESVWSKLDAQHTLIEQSVITKLIHDQNVTTPKIADLNVTEIKMADNSVSTRTIQKDAVITEKIANENVIAEKIGTDAVITRTIMNHAVVESKIAPNAVTTTKIMNSNVTRAKINDRAINAEKIDDSAVITRTIHNDAVTEPKILNGAVTEFKIADQAIHAHNIATGGVSNSNLQNACVSTEKIEDLAVINSKIGNETIQGKDKIVRNSITKDRLELPVIDRIDRAVLHDGNGNVTGEGNSTVLNNIKATGDIYAHRVYNVVYMDIAEAYEPGEALEAGDIVAMCEDGKVRKATSIRDCIVGVVSNEYAHCLGASKEELLCGDKIAVGMIGKIHVKVKGPVRLGQRVGISLSDPGVGMANWMNNNNNIGQVLESVDCDFDHIHTVLVQVRPI